MGDVNQYDFVRTNRSLFQEPLLEVGSRDYGTTQNLRELYPDQAYLGIDMLDGDGVDLVLDLTQPFDDVDRQLKGKRFNAIFCMSVLEHCDQPFRMAENMTRLLNPEGKMFISVPFAFKFHGYPSDYWRFTHEGVKKLFPALTFDSQLDHVSTQTQGDRFPIDTNLGRLHFSGSWHRRQGHWFRGLTSDVLRLLSRIGLYHWLVRDRYVLRPTMINMVGTL